MSSAPRTTTRVGAILGSLLLVVSLTAACFDTETGDESGTGTGIDREALLGEIEEVRDLFDQQSPLDPQLIQDASYEEGQLTVTLADTVEGVEEAEQVCDDLAAAIELPDLEITVNGPDGESMATCQFGSNG